MEVLFLSEGICLIFEQVSKETKGIMHLLRSSVIHR